MLFSAAATGDVALLTSLLATGASPSWRDRYGRTALHEAAMEGQLACVNILWPVSDVEARDGGGRTPLMLAAFNHQDDVIHVLAPLCDPKAVDHFGCDAADLAGFHGGAQLPLALWLRSAMDSQAERLALDVPCQSLRPGVRLKRRL